ncbi:MAG: peptidoglycan D,D-transpeptidase FtsI family protein [Chitinophagaceae bacterium]
MQLLKNDYTKQATQNVLFEKRLYVERGGIYDRNHKIIVHTKLYYDLLILPSDVIPFDTILLCKILNITQEEVEKKINDAILKNGRNRTSVFVSSLDQSTYAKIFENLPIFQGFDIAEHPIRIYPDSVGGHFLGYISEVSQEIIKKKSFYSYGDYVGMAGLEKEYDSVLRGKNGIEYWIKNNHNKLIGRYDNGSHDKKSSHGQDLHTTIDIELQKIAEQLLTNKVGAIVAIEPSSGEILSLASGTTYDPNLLSETNRPTSRALLEDPSSPLLNRAISGTYSPGSTYKPIGGLIALNENIINPSFSMICKGAYLTCISPVKCGHSNIEHSSNLTNAIAYSCNSYFTQIFRMFIDHFPNPKQGIVQWYNYMNLLGFGQKLGIDLPNERKGYIPDTIFYNHAYPNGKWNSCTIKPLGIGQGEISMTPLQLSNAMCIIANRGYYAQPHLVKAIDKMPIKRNQKNALHINNEAYDAIINGMENVVNFGTGAKASVSEVAICGKTGTVQNYRKYNGKRRRFKNTGIFVGFAPKENPKIAFAIVVENSGFGATYAVPMASLIVEKYLKRKLSEKNQKLLKELSKENTIYHYLHPID